MHKEFMYHFELCWHAHPSQHNKSRSEHKLWWHFWDAAATPMRGGGGNEDNDNSNNKHMAEYSNAIVSSHSSCCCCLEPEDGNHLIIVVHDPLHRESGPSLHSNHYFGSNPLASNVVEIASPVSRSFACFTSWKVEISEIVVITLIFLVFQGKKWSSLFAAFFCCLFPPLRTPEFILLPPKPLTIQFIHNPNTYTSTHPHRIQ